MNELQEQQRVAQEQPKRQQTMQNNMVEPSGTWYPPPAPQERQVPTPLAFPPTPSTEPKISSKKWREKSTPQAIEGQNYNIAQFVRMLWSFKNANNPKDIDTVCQMVHGLSEQPLLIGLTFDFYAEEMIKMGYSADNLNWIFSTIHHGNFAQHALFQFGDKIVSPEGLAVTIGRIAQITKRIVANESNQFFTPAAVAAASERIEQEAEAANVSKVAQRSQPSAPASQTPVITANPSSFKVPIEPLNVALVKFMKSQRSSKTQDRQNQEVSTELQQLHARLLQGQGVNGNDVDTRMLTSPLTGAPINFSWNPPAPAERVAVVDPTRMSPEESQALQIQTSSGMFSMQTLFSPHHIAQGSVGTVATTSSQKAPKTQRKRGAKPGKQRASKMKQTYEKEHPPPAPAPAEQAPNWFHVAASATDPHPTTSLSYNGIPMSHPSLAMLARMAQAQAQNQIQVQAPTQAHAQSHFPQAAVPPQIRNQACIQDHAREVQAQVRTWEAEIQAQAQAQAWEAHAQAQAQAQANARHQAHIHAHCQAQAREAQMQAQIQAQAQANAQAQAAQAREAQVHVLAQEQAREAQIQAEANAQAQFNAQAREAQIRAQAREAQLQAQAQANVQAQLQAQAQANVQAQLQAQAQAQTLAHAQHHAYGQAPVQAQVQAPAQIPAQAQAQAQAAQDAQEQAQLWAHVQAQVREITNRAEVDTQALLAHIHAKVYAESKETREAKAQAQAREAEMQTPAQRQTQAQAQTREAQIQTQAREIQDAQARAQAREIQILAQAREQAQLQAQAETIARAQAQAKDQAWEAHIQAQVRLQDAQAQPQPQETQIPTQDREDSVQAQAQTQSLHHAPSEENHNFPATQERITKSSGAIPPQSSTSSAQHPQEEQEPAGLNAANREFLTLFFAGSSQSGTQYHKAPEPVSAEELLKEESPIQKIKTTRMAVSRLLTNVTQDALIPIPDETMLKLHYKYVANSFGFAECDTAAHFLDKALFGAEWYHRLSKFDDVKPELNTAFLPVLVEVFRRAMAEVQLENELLNTLNMWPSLRHKTRFRLFVLSHLETAEQKAPRHSRDKMAVQRMILHAFNHFSDLASRSKNYDVLDVITFIVFNVNYYLHNLPKNVFESIIKICKDLGIRIV